MSKVTEHCTKCKKDGHNLEVCEQEDWLPWEQQECDVCGKVTDPPHEALFCDKKDKPKPTLICFNRATGRGCGHVGHSQNRCLIKNTDIDKNVNQYTKSQYEFAMEGRSRSRKRPVGNTPPPQTPSTPANPNPAAPTLKNASSRQASNGAASSYHALSTPTAAMSSALPSHTRPPPASPATSSSGKSPSGSKGAIFRPSIKKASNRPLPELTDREQQRTKNAKLNLQLAPFSTATAAKKEKVITNFFKVDITRNVGIRKYRIVLGKLGPGKDARSIKRREAKKAVIEDIFRQCPPNAKLWICDYASHIISVGRLYNMFVDDVNVPWSVIHQVPGQGGTKVQVDSTIHYEGTLGVDQLRRHISQTQERDVEYSPDEDIRILNMISWKHIYDTTSPVGHIAAAGKKFYPLHLQTSQLTENNGTVAILRKGFFSSMRPADGTLMLNVNVTATPFYPPVVLDDYIRVRCGGPNPPAALIRELKELRVYFDQDQPAKLRTVKLFGQGDCSNLTFPFQGANRSVRDHMNLAHNVPLDQLKTDAACVSVGQLKSGAQIWYPTDLLRIAPHQLFKAKMSPAWTSEMLNFAMKRPNGNQSDILDYSRKALGIVEVKVPATPPKNGYMTIQPFYLDFGLTVNRDFTRIDHRFLSSPNISFMDSRQRIPFDLNIIQESKWNKERVMSRPLGKRWALDTASWDLRKITGNKDITFSRVGRHSNTIYLLHFNNPRHSKDEQRDIKNNAVALARNLGDELRKYGFNITGAPKCTDVTFDPQAQGSSQTKRNNLCMALSSAIARWGGADLSGTVVLVGLSDTDAATYSDVKWWGDCRAGVRTLCFSPASGEKGRKKDLNFCGNLALKFNYRLGGINHRLSNHHQLPLKGSTMIVGADVTHPGKCPDDNCPSMAGVVATHDSDAMTYTASARLQAKDTEQIADLQGMLLERLDFYKTKNGGVLPEHILFYRDGVSESQYGDVRKYELSQVEAACRQAAGLSGSVPRITLIIVAKRHHARFYSTDNEYPDYNTRSGLVVDIGVVYPKQFNFYLQAHDSPIGTARNAHYVVLENQSGYNADELQDITNKICFMGSRALKGLSVATPARYADILCDRLRRYMRLSLESDIFSNNDINRYRQNGDIWIAPNATRTNPWHPNLNEVMFYL